MTRGVPNTIADFWAQVDKSGGEEACWPWTGTVNPRGYAMFAYQSDNWMVHALAVHLTRGEQLSQGHFVHRDHLCHDPALCPPGENCPHRRCCNPLHIETVSAAVNAARSGSVAGMNARKEFCDRGHEFTEENTRWQAAPPCRPSRQPSRVCRTCERQRRRISRGRARFKKWAGL